MSEREETKSEQVGLKTVRQKRQKEKGREKRKRTHTHMKRERGREIETLSGCSSSAALRYALLISAVDASLSTPSTSYRQRVSCRARDDDDAIRAKCSPCISL